MTRPCVCVTGATQGIGFAIAEAFAHRGARLVINAHEPGGAAQERLGQLTECHFVQADLSTVAGAKELVGSAHRLLGRLDTLVNNAGTFCDVPFEKVSEETYARTFEPQRKGLPVRDPGLRCSGLAGAGGGQRRLRRLDELAGGREEQCRL